MKRVLKELHLSAIAAVDRPCQEGALAMIMKRDFSDKQREKLADKGQAMSDGSYPIANTSDLANAIKAFGRAKNPEATKRHIISRARALGATGSLPEDWKVSKLDAAGRLTKQLLGLDDGFDDFDKAYDDALESMAECDDDYLAKYFEEYKGPIAEIVSDDQLSDLGKHLELYEGLNALISTAPVEAQAQLEKALDTSERIREVSKRLGSLTRAAKLTKRASVLRQRMKAA